MAIIRVGFVGLGSVCRQKHVPGLRAIEGVKIVAVANRTRESSNRVSAELDIPEVYEDWRELVARADLDAIVVGTWPYMHREVSVAALESGKHVLCQARMAMDYSDALEMYRCARRTGKVAMVCPVPIGLTKDATMRRYVDQRRLGEIRLVRVHSMSDSFADADAPATWRKDHRLSGLNMHTLGMYVEVVHRWFGWTRAVQASTQTFVAERTDSSGQQLRIEIPDQVLINTELTAGFPVQYTISTVVHHGEDAIEVYGSEGSLRYEVASDTLYGAAPGQPMGSATIDVRDTADADTWRVERDFIDAIRDGTEYHPSFEDGLKYMQVIQAVYDSAREGRRIELL
jgi:predicted dehydrogenase